MAAEPPVLPGGEEARRWAQEELAKPEYREASTGWVPDLWESLRDWLRSLDGGSVSDGASAVPWIGVAAAVLIGAAIIFARPRLNATGKPSADIFDAEPTVSATEYRERAAAAASAGDWNSAVVDCFRALVRTAEERNVLDTRAGRTADEVAQDLAVPFSAEAGRLAEAARTFDRIRYGNEPTGRAAYVRMFELDTALRSLKPARQVPEQHDEAAVPR